MILPAHLLKEFDPHKALSERCLGGLVEDGIPGGLLSQTKPHIMIPDIAQAGHDDKGALANCNRRAVEDALICTVEMYMAETVWKAVQG